MRSGARARGVAALLAGALLAACGQAPPTGPPNVVLIVVDTLRPDHLGVYGYERETSPSLDKLSEDSVVFRAAQSHAPWTLPSATTLLTGRDAALFGIVDEVNTLDDDLLLLSELLQEADYTTAAIVSHKFVSAEWGFAQGFDQFDDSDARGHMAITSPRLTQKALAFLEAHQDERFFLFLHYFDPHFVFLEHEGFAFPADAPYEGVIRSGMRYFKLIEIQGMLDEEDAAELRRYYDSEIAFTDHHIGRVLERLRELDLYDDALIIVTADHGEEFLDHGQIGHGKTLHEELLRVPLLVHFPGGKAGESWTPVGLADVFPTVLEAAGIELPAGTEGISLRRAQEGRLLFASTERRGGFRSVRGERFKLIRPVVGAAELYDLAADPTERTNLLERGNEVPSEELERLSAALRPYIAKIATFPRPVPRRELSPEERKMLQELGYLDQTEIRY